MGQKASELDGWALKAEHHQGKFRLGVYENPSYRPAKFDFVDALDPKRAELHEEVGGKAQPCPWNANARVSHGGLGGPPTFPRKRFECPSGLPYFVGVTVIDDANYRARRCLWAHPIPNGVLSLRYRGVPVGTDLRVWAGMPFVPVRDLNGPPARIAVRINGRQVGTVNVELAQDWRLSELKVPSSESADVEFRVSAVQSHGRQLCFYADTW